jgi:1,4-dihydroxy-2-naphthoate octaprenyltransferase
MSTLAQSSCASPPVPSAPDAAGVRTSAHDAGLAAGRRLPPVVPGSVRAWLFALRPRSLLISVSPVLVGAAFAWARTDTLNPPFFLLALAASLLMQLITNLQNDVGYTARGAERHGNRIGLPRATAQGWLTPGQVRRAIVLCVAAAVLVGLPLVAERGWPAVAIGAVSIGAALAYMGGPWPIAYTPFGELVVFMFFGLVAVCGTGWALGGGIGLDTALAGAALGALAAAVLVVNNHRDTVHDRGVGRQTFAVLFGDTASAVLFGVLLLAPFVLVPIVAVLQGATAVLLPLVLAPLAWKLWLDLRAARPGLAFNELMFRTVKLELLFAALLVIGVVLGHLDLQAH